MKIGDTINVSGTILEVVHVQGEQHNLRVELANGNTLWITSTVLGLSIDPKPASIADDPELIKQPAPEETPIVEEPPVIEATAEAAAVTEVPAV